MTRIESIKKLIQSTAYGSAARCAERLCLSGSHSIFLLRLCLRWWREAEPQNFKWQRDGKAQPFRTSSGTAALALFWFLHPYGGYCG
jgi:hypothetical protein